MTEEITQIKHCFRPGHNAPANVPDSSRRQFHSLTDGEVTDLADSITRALVVELQRMNVAGAAEAQRWELADELRRTVTRHHNAAFRRYLAQRLEAAG